MAYTPQSNQFDYTPNSGVPFNVAASYEDTLFGETADRTVLAGEAGVGSLYKRAVATDMVTYFPWDFSFDTMVQLFGGFDTTPKEEYEWPERDMFYDYSAQGETLDQTDVVNNVTSGNYSPSSTARFIISADDASKFKQYFRIRYETSSGYQYAFITSVDDTLGDNQAELNIQSEDGSNLTVADADTAEVQRLGTNLPQDEDYDPQPQSSNPEMFYTYVENPRIEIKVNRELELLVNNNALFFDAIQHYRDQQAANFRRDREVTALTASGNKSRVELSSGDNIYFSNGVYERVKSTNLHTSDFKTNGIADPSKVKNALDQFMLYNFYGEHGGPKERMLFIDGTFGSYLDRTWEDIQRFDGNDFIAGVSVKRYTNSQGAIDISTVGSWSEIHPIKGGGIRGGGTPSAVGLMLPMQEDYVVRINQEGFGPREEIFKKDGGDRNGFYRLESKEGIALKKPQHMAVIEEA